MKRHYCLQTSIIFRAILILFLLIAPFQWSNAQITLSTKKVTLEKVIKSIKTKAKYQFFYNDNLSLIMMQPINVKNASIEIVLNKLFLGSGITYKIVDNTIYLSRDERKNTIQEPVRSKEGKGYKITGKVISESGEPLIGVSVKIKDSNIGNITNTTGHYSFTCNIDNPILIYSYIGYQTQEVPSKERSVINVVMKEETRMISEVVVTALGIKKEKKALGYAMQEIKTENLTENHSTSISNMLQGKVAGVQISQSGTGIGGSTHIVLRGISSLSGNNQPLWVVDGIPISDKTTSQATEWGYPDYSSSASEINPEDIESISVLKGPNAAALYGSIAQNGAIIITTKTGKKEQPLTIEYNGNASFDTPYSPYKLQNIYGQGTAGKFDQYSKASWGPLMDGKTTVDNWRNTMYSDNSYKPYALTPQGNQMMDFYRTGTSFTNSVALSAGGKSLFGRMSYSDSRNRGITPNHQLIRQYADANLNFVNKWITVGFKGSYIYQKGDNRPDQGDAGIANQFILMPRSIRLQDLKNPEGLDGSCVNWAGINNSYINPYAYSYKGNGNKDEKNHFIGQINASIILTDWLRINGKAGIDWYNINRQITMPFSFNSGVSQLTLYKETFKETNSDAMVNINKTFNDFNITANLGGAYRSERDEGVTAFSGRLALPGLLSLSNGKNIQAEQLYSYKEVHSVLGNMQVGFRNMLYLDITGRNDWSSTLPKNNRSYFYPSASLSGIVSEMIKLPNWIDFLKVRGSWAEVGNDTDPYKLKAANYVFSMLSTTVSSASLELPLSTLKPESTKSYETGIDFRMLKNKINLDFTYYHSTTTNQILGLSISSSSGYTNQIINAGKMVSSGFEVMLGTTPLKIKDWQWDLNLNWGTNNSHCKSLDPQIKRWSMGSVRIGDVVVREGHKFGDIIGKAYVRDEAGNIKVDDNGLPIYESDQVIGNMMPDWTGSINSTLKWKGLSFNMLIDIRQGGDIISETDAIACASGNSKRTLNFRDGGMIVKGVNINTGNPNNIKITSEQFYSQVGGAEGVGEEFKYSGSYIKMREMSLSWELPKLWIQNLSLKSVKVSLVGRDLFYLKKHTPGNPECAFSRSDFAQAFDVSAMPPTRTFGFNLNVKF